MVGVVVRRSIAINLYAWQAQHYVLNIAGAAHRCWRCSTFLNMAWGFFMETRSRRLITGLFGTYVPKELVAEMSKNPEEYSMRGESRDMTVLFSDVRDFTSISEGLTPERPEGHDERLPHGDDGGASRTSAAPIDKYIGDAIMAFWGAPVPDTEHATHARGGGARDAEAHPRASTPTFVEARLADRCNIGVGLNCGEMNVGDMGSKFRRAYTVMGDAVNLASRLEGLTKEYGVGILVSENVVRGGAGLRLPRGRQGAR